MVKESDGEKKREKNKPARRYWIKMQSKMWWIVKPKQEVKNPYFNQLRIFTAN